MTAHRRPMFLLAAAALSLPACLNIQAHTTPLTPPEVRDRLAAEAQARAKAEAGKKSEFAVFPSRPGETVAINPAPKETTSAVSQKPPEKVAEEAPPPEVKPAGDPGRLPVRPAPLLSSAAEPPVLAAVRAYAEGRPDRAIDILKALRPANQELILAVLPILARGATADLASDPVAAAVLAEQLRSAASRLEPRAALRIENATFCRKVDGFGRYDPWPAGQPYRPNDQAEFYFEVQNLPSQPATGPHGETHLTLAHVSVEVRDAKGMLVPQPDPQDRRRRVPVVRFETQKFTRGPIRDYHLRYPLLVPGGAGVYDVTVEVRDASGRRVVRSEPVRFDVAGP
jgi:hypothetical protein